MKIKDFLKAMFVGALLATNHKDSMANALANLENDINHMNDTEVSNALRGAVSAANQEIATQNITTVYQDENIRALKRKKPDKTKAPSASTSTGFKGVYDWHICANIPNAYINAKAIELQNSDAPEYYKLNGKTVNYNGVQVPYTLVILWDNPQCTGLPWQTIVPWEFVPSNLKPYLLCSEPSLKAQAAFTKVAESAAEFTGFEKKMVESKPKGRRNLNNHF